MVDPQELFLISVSFSPVLTLDTSFSINSIENIDVSSIVMKHTMIDGWNSGVTYQIKYYSLDIYNNNNKNKTCS